MGLTNLSIPRCLGPIVEPSRPRFRLPAGTWDTHFHPLGPQSRFPYDSARRYTPPDAPFEMCLALHKQLGVSRGLVIHANTHGNDNSVFLDAMERSEGRYLGVLRLTSATTLAECRALHARGTRGVRFAFNPQHGGDLDQGEVAHVVKCAADLGWFAEFHFAATMLKDLTPWLKEIPTQVVIDHIGRIDVREGLEQEPFQLLTDLFGRDNIWIKISGIDRLSEIGAPYADLAPFLRRLLEIAPDRLLWGTDWPHTGYFSPNKVPDDGELVDALEYLVPSAQFRQVILVENPRRLVGEQCFV